MNFNLRFSFICNKLATGTVTGVSADFCRKFRDTPLEKPQKSGRMIPAAGESEWIMTSVALAVNQILTVAVSVGFSGFSQIIFYTFDFFCFIVGFF